MFDLDLRAVIGKLAATRIRKAIRTEAGFVIWLKVYGLSWLIGQLLIDQKTAGPAAAQDRLQAELGLSLIRFFPLRTREMLAKYMAEPLPDGSDLLPAIQKILTSPDPPEKLVEEFLELLRKLPHL